jgi:2-succinyl-5-enolpyruvyl-6-hydroxy-3-cyclohexene-1-carboxylate synthase
VTPYSASEQIAYICAQHGVGHAIVCPGSRSAPLTLAFARNKQIETRIFSDERSAAFIALGLAQQTQRAVALVCTSGSAAYNFAPAVTEAFYSHVPLLIFTADRPTEWVDQLDGQTIRQQHIFGDHVKKFFQLPHDYQHADSAWYLARSINEAAVLAVTGTPGPVHLNVPFREPFYPSKTDAREPATPKVFAATQAHHALSKSELANLAPVFQRAGRILVVGGQQGKSDLLTKSLAQLQQKQQVVVLADVVSNLHELTHCIRLGDTLLSTLSEEKIEQLRPDLLISLGRSTVSKNVKLFLRKYRPQHHWHIQLHGTAPDTFQSLTSILIASPHLALAQLAELPPGPSIEMRSAYANRWQEYEDKAKRKVAQFFTTRSHSEFGLVHQLSRTLPPHTKLHLANSMSVRYANMVGMEVASTEVFANRGTSGIDGCSSTAMGHAFGTSKLNVLITGDVAFFYDRNAFWHSYTHANLRIVLLNNSGGLIFSLIDGPAQLPELDEYFITQQTLSARHLAAEFNIDYKEVNEQNMADAVHWLYAESSRPRLLEIRSSAKASRKVFEDFKEFLKK